MPQPIPQRALDVAVEVRRLTVLARLTQDSVPVNGDRSWVAEATENAGPPLTPFEVTLVETADDYDYLLAEVLLRLY